MSSMSVDELFRKLIEIIATLRGENGCPWDREQTRESVKMNLIEEAYEALDAIHQNKPDMFAQELGDLMMQIVFHARISQEMGEFGMREVLTAAVEKLIRRHPHVFAQEEVADSADVLKKWEEIKKSERGSKSVLAEIPRSQPGFMQALVVQEKVARVGFEWPDVSGAIDKVIEELHELRCALQEGARERIHEEYGDLLMIAINLGRYLKSNPDDALRDAVQRFEGRFKYVEDALREQGKSPDEASLELMDFLWDESKRRQRK
ncbi:MAG: nucleoside triphosphate pyrophosphohydrolase [Candidatus Coatesbacteria bacterium]|nr:nucleoside triphosphate pyrophosphohydrolase [Candidatus Coatesbacteria bacterium]